MEHLDLSGRLLRLAFAAALIGSAEECAEQRMRLERLRFELWMELAANKVRMVSQFDHLDISPLGSRSGNSQACGGQLFFIFAVELVAMTVPLADFGLAVNF